MSYDQDPDLAYEERCIEDGREAVARGFENTNQLQIHEAAQQVQDILQDGKDWAEIQRLGDRIRLLAWDEQGFPPFGAEDEDNLPF